MLAAKIVSEINYVLPSVHFCNVLSTIPYNVTENTLKCVMMTSSNGNFFLVTGHLCGEFIGPQICYRFHWISEYFQHSTVRQLVVREIHWSPWFPPHPWISNCVAADRNKRWLLNLAHSKTFFYLVTHLNTLLYTWCYKRLKSTHHLLILWIANYSLWMWCMFKGIQ